MSGPAADIAPSPQGMGPHARIDSRAVRATHRTEKHGSNDRPAPRRPGGGPRAGRRRHRARPARDPRPDHHGHRDRRAVPVAGRRRLAAVEQPAALARPRRVRDLLCVLRPRRDGRLPPAVHPPELQDEPVHARPLRGRRLHGDRGPGHLLGGRPPQAPRVLRPARRSAQPARRPRRRLARRAARSRARARRVAVHPHAARQPQALRPGPARGPGGRVRRPHVHRLGARRASSRRSSSAG